MLDFFYQDGGNAFNPDYPFFRLKVNNAGDYRLGVYYNDIINMNIVNTGSQPEYQNNISSQNLYSLEPYLEREFQSIVTPSPLLFGVWSGIGQVATGNTLPSHIMPKTLWGYINMYRIMSSLNKFTTFYDINDEGYGWGTGGHFEPYFIGYDGSGLLGTGPFLTQAAAGSENLHMGDEYVIAATEALMMWSYVYHASPTPPTTEDPPIDLQPIITDGCDERLYPERDGGVLFVNEAGELLYKMAEGNSEGLEGLQFSINDNYTILDVINDGDIQDANWAVTFNENLVLTFKQPSNDSFPIGEGYESDDNPRCGKLLTLLFDPNGPEWNPVDNSAYLHNIVTGTTDIDNNSWETDIGEDYFEYFDVIGGCGDMNALNYNEYITPGCSDSSQCEFPDLRPIDDFNNTLETILPNYPYRYDEENYWDGSLPEKTFSMESSVGQIFITDNQDLSLSENCKLEFNTGQIDDKAVYDSSGNANKGLLIGDYKIKKNEKNQPMRRDSFIKLPKKTNNKNGAL